MVKVQSGEKVGPFYTHAKQNRGLTSKDVLVGERVDVRHSS